MPIVSDAFWASASASVSWRTRSALALASSVSRIREPDSAARSTAEASSRSGRMSACVPSSSSASHSLRRRVWAARSDGVEPLELGARSGLRRHHQGVLDAGPAGQRDADDVDVDGERLGPRPAHRGGPGAHLEVGVPPADGGEQQGADHRRQHRHADVEQREHERRHASPGRGTARRSRACRACGESGRGRARRGRPAAAARRPRRAAPRPTATSGARRSPATARPAPTARGSTSSSASVRSGPRRRRQRPGDQPHAGAEQRGEHGGPDHGPTPTRRAAATCDTRSSRSERAGRDSTTIAHTERGDDAAHAGQHELPGERAERLHVAAVAERRGGRRRRRRSRRSAAPCGRCGPAPR